MYSYVDICCDGGSGRIDGGGYVVVVVVTVYAHAQMCPHHLDLTMMVLVHPLMHPQIQHYFQHYLTFFSQST